MVERPMSETKLAWGDLVRAGRDGPVMFVSTPELGEEHNWEGVRNGVYCIWREHDAERWEIYPRQHLQIIERTEVKDPADPAHVYEATTQEVIKRLRQLTVDAFGAAKDVQKTQYLLAVGVFEEWVSKLGDEIHIRDRDYLEMIVDQNPAAHFDEQLSS